MWLKGALIAMAFSSCLLIAGTSVTSIDRPQDAKAPVDPSADADQTPELHPLNDTLWQKSRMSNLRKIENAELEKLTEDELRTAVKDLARHVRVLKKRVSQLENPPVRILPVERR